MRYAIAEVAAFVVPGEKLFWGGLRVGFVRAPAPVALRFARVKAADDLGSSAVGQVLAERVAGGGGHGRGRRPGAYLASRRTELRARYDVLVEGVARLAASAGAASS